MKRPRRPIRTKKSRHVALDTLEARLCLTAAPSPGIDALSLGDVNGDRVADIAVASHGGGHTSVTIYSGTGTKADVTTGQAPLVLATITDPFGAGGGALDATFGDFDGDGVSELAITGAGSPRVATYRFAVRGTTPVNALVTPIAVGTPFSLPGYAASASLSIVAADIHGDGRDRLIAARADRTGTIAAFKLESGGAGWSRTRTLDDLPVSKMRGVNLDAADVTGDGVVDVAALSLKSGRAAVYDGALERWTWVTPTVKAGPKANRVAIVASENATGSLVLANAQGNGSLVPYATNRPIAFTPVATPGAGGLVPLGGGYVYQRSSIRGVGSSFPTSSDPVTPTILFASTGGTQLVIQGFDATLRPSRADFYVEPIGGAAGAGFWPLQPGRGAEATGSAQLTVASDLIAFPDVRYRSPYTIDLKGAAKGSADGLTPYTSVQTTTLGPWGPDKVPNVAPDVPTGASNDWLRDRMMAAYNSQIGVDYQHHHDPNWLPAQGSAWNLTSTVGYQSRGIDCTNFTAWAYADALGIVMNSDTAEQAKIRFSDPNGTVIPDGLKDRIAIQTIDHWSGYDDLVKQLVPGDILIINGDDADRSKATHAITWLGDYGVDSNGKHQHLIIDSTGTEPDHVDSGGHVVAEGVHIRPFGEPGSLNEWYFKHVDHVLRFIKDDRTAPTAISGSELPATGEASKKLDAAATVDALVVLRHRTDIPGLPSLESLAEAPLDKRTFLSRDDFAAKYGADPADIAEVKAWAGSHGLDVVATDAASRTVRLEGKVSEMEEALNTRLYEGNKFTGHSWSYEGPIYVPKDLHDTIQGVFGVAKSTETAGSEKSGDSDRVNGDKGYTPPELAKKYDFPDATGKGQTVGVIELSGTIDDKVRAELKVYFDSLGLAMPSITQVGAKVSEPTHELYLDLEVIGALVPDAKIATYFAHDTPGDFFQAVQTAVHDAAHPIDTLSMSVAFPEANLSSNYLDVASQAFLEAAAMGVSVFASAGDYGSSRDVPDGLAHFEFPSSSPWVTSVGGTSLPRDQSIDRETVWDNYKVKDGVLSGGKGATGGGVSDHFAVPDYQKGLDIRSVNPGHHAGRGGPDVASIADPDTGIWIYADGNFFHDGGTSAAAPAWAALATRINQKLGRNVGFYNTLIYDTLGPSDAFHDITKGKNTASFVVVADKDIPTHLGYDAHEGWDMTTGWGSPDGTNLLEGLRKLLKKRDRSA